MDSTKVAHLMAHSYPLNQTIGARVREREGMRGVKDLRGAVKTQNKRSVNETNPSGGTERGSQVKRFLILAEESSFF